MLRTKSKAVPEGNGPVPQDISGLLGGTTLEELRRIMPEVLDKFVEKHYELKPENSKERRATNQYLAGADMMLDRHVLTRRQTYQPTRRLGSVRRALQQIKRSMGIVVLHKGTMPAR